jgi:hypothetical protein
VIARALVGSVPQNEAWRHCCKLLFGCPVGAGYHAIAALAVAVLVGGMGRPSAGHSESTGARPDVRAPPPLSGRPKCCASAFQSARRNFTPTLYGPGPPSTRAANCRSPARSFRCFPFRAAATANLQLNSVLYSCARTHSPPRLQ